MDSMSPSSPRIVVLSCIALTIGCAACASSGASPRPFPVAGRQTADTRKASSEAWPDVDAGDLVSTALALRGTPYRDGGSDPEGFDCSGFTQWVFARHGIALPREVRTQFTVGQMVKPDALERGDLVFFATTTSGASHVGIMVGTDVFVHAPSSTGVVRVERLSARYWAARLVGVRRLSAN